MERFPDIDVIVGRIIAKFGPSIVMDVQTINSALYTTLLMVICSVYQKERLYPKIRVELDLPGLAGTQQMISNMILGMPEFNVDVTAQHDSDVDIVISSANRQDVARENLFEWRRLPTDKQVRQLRARLRELRLKT